MTQAGPLPDLTILESHVYRGPNIWSYDTSVHLVVDLGSLEQHPSNELPGFTAALPFGELLRALIDEPDADAATAAKIREYARL